jgi:hypothetical protein
LVKAAELVPVLFQIIEQIEINDVIAVMAAIDEFYITLPDPTLYARGLAVATIQVGVHWTIRHVQAITAVAAKESALIGQVVSEELKKFIYYRATQAIFKKYHSDLDPKLRDTSVTFTAFAKFFEFKVTSEQEFSLTKTYEGSPFPNNEFAMTLYDKVYGKSKPKDPNNAVTATISQSANLAKSDNWCFHPLCRGKKKFANHTWENCYRNKRSAHSKQQASNRKDAAEAQTKVSSASQQNKYHKGGFHKEKQRQNKNFNSNNLDATNDVKGLTKNSHGNFASPAVRHTLSKVHHMSNADRKTLVPELQRALAVENIAAKFVN